MQLISEQIHVPVSERKAFEVLSGVETVFRLSPYWTLREFKSLAAGGYEVKIEYYDSEKVETHRLEVGDSGRKERISWAVEGGILKEITFVVEKENDGIRLTQQFLLDSGDTTLIDGTHREMQLWLRSIGAYLRLAEGRTFCRRLWKRFMDKVWLRLTLSERKIAIIITKISVIEILLLLFLVLLWNLFADSG